MSSFWAQRTASERRMIILCLIVVAVAVPLMLFPGSGGGKKLLSAKEARLQYDSKLKEKTQLETDNDRLKPLIDQSLYKESPEQLIPKVIRTLQGFAKDSGIHLREIKPLRSKRLGNVTKETLSVRFTTDFAKTVPFFYRVDDPAGRLVMEKFNLTASDPKTRTVDVDAQIALYTQSEAAAAEGS